MHILSSKEAIWDGKAFKFKEKAKQTLKLKWGLTNSNLV